MEKRAMGPTTDTVVGVWSDRARPGAVNAEPKGLLIDANHFVIFIQCEETLSDTRDPTRAPVGPCLRHCGGRRFSMGRAEWARDVAEGGDCRGWGTQCPAIRAVKYLSLRETMHRLAVMARAHVTRPLIWKLYSLYLILLLSIN